MRDIIVEIVGILFYFSLCASAEIVSCDVRVKQLLEVARAELVRLVVMFPTIFQIKPHITAVGI